MNCRTQVVLAAGIGYLLGRQHKLRWGLMLGAAAASGRLSRPGGLLQHGVKALSASPELGKLTELAAPLVAATKDAAQAAATGPVRREREEEQEEEEEQPKRRARAAEGAPEEEEERPRRRARAVEREPEADEEELYEEPEARESRRSVQREPDGRRSRQSAQRDDENEDDEQSADEGESPSVLARSRPDVGGRPPVQRRGR